MSWVFSLFSCLFVLNKEFTIIVHSNYGFSYKSLRLVKRFDLNRSHLSKNKRFLLP